MNIARAAGAALFCIASVVPPLAAQSDPCASAPIVYSKFWSTPLSRTVSIDAAPTTLRDALPRIAAAAKVRVSFSSDLLPNSTVCMAWRDAPVGDVLKYILADSNLEATVAGNNQIVITRVQRDELPDSRDVIQLAPLYATADARRPRMAPAGTAVTTIDVGSAITPPMATLASLLNASVPGMWLWQSTAGLGSMYGSNRGASSFGNSAPKILIDGVEVANPMLLSRIPIETVERIEIVRGPQGSARYGADALNGVTNITTRHDAGAANLPRLRASSAFGVTTSRFSKEPAITQDHSMRLQLGPTDQSIDISVGAGSTGAYAPGAGTRYTGADGSVRLVGEHSVIAGTVRMMNQSVDTTGQATGVAAVYRAMPNSNFDTALPLALSEYAAGISASYSKSDAWTHSIVAGIDGYRLDGLHSALDQFSPSHSLLREAGTSGLRTTLRASSESRRVSADAVTTMSLTADHFSMRNASDLDGAKSRSSAGVATEIAAVIQDHLALTTALRIAYDMGGGVEGGRMTLLPMIGGAIDNQFGPIDLTMRASYGTGIRWPSPSAPASLNAGLTSLEPEKQTGIEAGFDLNVADVATLQVTRFDQTASGLATSERTAETLLNEGVRNVGEISNSGWEVAAILRQGAFSIASTIATVDSRVLRVSAVYTGELTPGDRPLAVPARTISLSGMYVKDRWSASVIAYRAMDWINYDRVALGEELARRQIKAAPPSEARTLRDYWTRYNGFTHLDANATHTLSSGFVVLLSASNLLDSQLGEPDNGTIVPGRTLSIGLRAAF